VTVMVAKEIIDRIFKEPGIKCELTEFDTLGKPVHEILTIYAKIVETGRDAGKTKYFLKSFIPFSSGNEEVQVYMEGGKSAPEGLQKELRSLIDRAAAAEHKSKELMEQAKTRVEQLIEEAVRS
jgi:hypothetical protein